MADVLLILVLGASAVLAVLAAWSLRLRRVERARCVALEERVAELEHSASAESAIARGMPDGFFVLDSSGRLVDCNDAFARLIGWERAELLGRTIDEIELDLSHDTADGAGYSAATQRMTAAYRRRDGECVHLESAVFVIGSGAGRRVVVVARDVSYRVRLEQRLRQSEARYRTLVETSTDLIWALDLEGRWTFVNSAARQIYGWEPAELLGRSIFETIHPGRHERARQNLDGLRRGEPRLRFETEHLRRDGGTVVLSVNAVPLHDEHGDVIGVTGTSTDITHRKVVEERLLAAHQRFELLVAGMPLGYIVWSEDARVIEWNPAASEIFGYGEEAALGRSASELVLPPESTESFRAMFSSRRDGPVGQSVVLVNRKKNGEKAACEWYSTVLPDMLGSGRVIATLVRDVSERERLETQLRQSQKLESLGVLAGGIAHDFNNLLVGILGNASLAMESLPYESPLRPLLERVVNAGRRATDLTQRMLAYAGRAATDIQPTDLNDMVAELAVFASAAIPKNISLTINTAAALPLIETDSAQMQQVIMNLLINAAEAIGDRSGQVTVSTWSETLDEGRIANEFASHGLTPGAYVVLEVRDTGCGMSPDVVERMYEPFFTTKFAGRGLGLSALLGIVQAHRGAITCSSALGQGTVFRVHIPALSDAQRSRVARTQPELLQPGTTILVIDDEEDVRDVVHAVLERRGINVLSAADGPEGVRVYREHVSQVDAVLLDLNMPGMSGEAVFRELRRIKSDVRVVLSTGYSEQEAATQFRQSEIAGFIPKPYTATALLARLGAALRDGERTATPA
jgi:PAS domain S-box-containing protein